MYVSIQREVAKKMDPGSPQWCQALGQDNRHKTDAQEVAPDYEKELYCIDDHALEQAAQRGCGVSQWSYSRTVWMQSCAMCSRMTLTEHRSWTR